MTMQQTFDHLARLVRAEQAHIDSHMQTAARLDAEADAGLIAHHTALALAAARRQEAHRAEIGRRFPARVGE